MKKNTLCRQAFLDNVKQNGKINLKMLSIHTTDSLNLFHAEYLSFLEAGKIQVAN